MPEPHTHGGTDAPECTTCRPTNDLARRRLCQPGPEVDAPSRVFEGGNLSENVTNDDVSRAFGPEVLACPDCGHGIDPHGVDPGGPCGVSDCPCLMQPNGIACLLIEARVREAYREGACDTAATNWTPFSDE